MIDNHMYVRYEGWSKSNAQIFHTHERGNTGLRYAQRGICTFKRRAVQSFTIVCCVVEILSYVKDRITCTCFVETQTLHCYQLLQSHFTRTVFSNGTVHLAQFLVPFMQFVDGSKMGRHIFDSYNCVATRPCI